MRRPTLLLACALLLACGDDSGSESGGGTGSGATASTSNGSSTSTSATGPSSTGSGEGSGTSSADTSSGSGDPGMTTGSGSDSSGSAGSGTTGDAGIDCNPTTVKDDGPVPECPRGEVPQVINGSWGACVPILMCATEPSCDDCLSGLCVEYQAFVTDYRCVAPTLTCAALDCSCLAPFVCVDPFDACGPSISDAAVSCACPTC